MTSTSYDTAVEDALCDLAPAATAASDERRPDRPSPMTTDDDERRAPGTVATAPGERPRPRSAAEPTHLRSADRGTAGAPGRGRAEKGRTACATSRPLADDERPGSGPSGVPTVDRRAIVTPHPTVTGEERPTGPPNRVRGDDGSPTGAPGRARSDGRGPTAATGRRVSDDRRNAAAQRRPATEDGLTTDGDAGRPARQAGPRLRLVPASPNGHVVQAAAPSAPPVLAERVARLAAITEREEVEDRGAAPATSPGRFAHGVGLACVEVVLGRRPAAQLARWLAPEVLDGLQQRASLVRRAGVLAHARRPAARRVRVCPLDAHTAEACLVVDDGVRVRAVALRLEAHRGVWRVTTLEIG